jgi:hypothetical protein
MDSNFSKQRILIYASTIFFLSSGKRTFSKNIFFLANSEKVVKFYYTDIEVFRCNKET